MKNPIGRRLVAVLAATFISLSVFTASAFTVKSANTTDSAIGEAKAKTIALEHAKVAESNTSRLHVELERDDGRVIYEVDFNVGRMEYEYEIDASSGKILEFDAEYDD